MNCSMAVSRRNREDILWRHNCSRYGAVHYAPSFPREPRKPYPCSPTSLGRCILEERSGRCPRSRRPDSGSPANFDWWVVRMLVDRGEVSALLPDRQTEALSEMHAQGQLVLAVKPSRDKSMQAPCKFSPQGSRAMNQSALSCTLAVSVSFCPIRFHKAIPEYVGRNFWHHGLSNNHKRLQGVVARLKSNSRYRQMSTSWRFPRLQKNSYIGIQSCPGPHHCPRQLNICRQNIKIVHASFDDEFRSSQSIALGLHRRYKSVVQSGFRNLRDFIDAGVTAYAVGCTTEDLRKELLNIVASGGDLEDTIVFSGSIGIKSKLTAEEVEECILWTSILFITILCTPQPTIVRWSSTPPVTTEAQVQWRGFCELIANAYYERGMAWMPVKTLQMEQMAVVGYAEEPSLIADRMRLVFNTLEVVSPQWPKR